jgi:hypothetical protein
MFHLISLYNFILWVQKYYIKKVGTIMANVKKIVRTEEFKMRLSVEEKELFYKYAEDIGISPSKLARNLILRQAEAKIENAVLLPFIKAYKAYLKATNQEALRQIESEE